MSTQLYLKPQMEINRTAKVSPAAPSLMRRAMDSLLKLLGLTKFYAVPMQLVRVTEKFDAIEPWKR